MTTRTRADLIAMLSRSIGEEAATAAVLGAGAALGFDTNIAAALSAQDALRILEVLASEPGLVGVAARFSKARVHMNWARG